MNSSIGRFAPREWPGVCRFATNTRVNCLSNASQGRAWWAKVLLALTLLVGLSSHAQEPEPSQGDRAVLRGASRILPASCFTDPLRHGPTQPAVAGVVQADQLSRPGAGLSCIGDPGSFTVLDGYFGNSFTGATERVIITGRRPDDYTVCVGAACRDYLRSMQDSASRLLSLGHQDAASSPQVVNAILNEIMPGYEDPCIYADEPGAAYLARAAANCRDYVHDALPGVLSPLEDLVAFFGCEPRVAEWEVTIFNRDALGDTSKVCKD